MLSFSTAGAVMAAATIAPAAGPGIEPAYATSSGGCGDVSFKKMSLQQRGSNFVREVSLQTAAAAKPAVIEIDYSIVENDDGNSYYKNRKASNPSHVSLIKGSTVKVGLSDRDLTNIDQIRSVALYRSGVSNCSILLGSVDSRDMVAFEKVGDDQFMVPIGGGYTAGKFGKLVVQIEGNDEFEQFYITSRGLRMAG